MDRVIVHSDEDDDREHVCDGEDDCWCDPLVIEIDRRPALRGASTSTGDFDG